MKRFVDTARFADPWYFDLPPEMKCAWEFIWANCDNAGVWVVNQRLADVQIGKKVDWKDFLSKCAGKIVELPRNRWHICDFVAFQCGKLSPDSRPHAVVIGLLRNHGILAYDSLSIVYPDSLCHTLAGGVAATPLDLDKDRDREKDKDQDRDTAPAKESRIKSRGTLEECKAYAVEVDLPESDGEACFHKWDGNGWTNGGAPIKDWRATIRSWKASGYMPSQKTPRNGAPKKPNGQYPENIQMPDLTPNYDEPEEPAQ